jgi:CBS domain-containing protein
MMFNEMTIRDIMTRGVITVPLDRYVRNVADIMSRQNVSGIAVVDHSGAVMGMISEIDMLKVILDESLLDATVEVIMNHNVQSVKPSTPLRTAAKIMMEKKIHRLLILSEPGVGASQRAVGIISASDIIKIIKES